MTDHMEHAFLGNKQPYFRKVLKSRPALHWDTVRVSTGELIPSAAGESELDLVPGVRRASARVVVNGPLRCA